MSTFTHIRYYEGVTSPHPKRDRKRPPAMADVALAAGVSNQTVSRVLNDSDRVRPETRARVLAAVDRLGYRRNAAARMLKTNRSGRIGMIAAHMEFHGPNMMLSAVNKAGHEAGYDVSLVSLDEVSAVVLQRAVGRLLDQAVEAIVVAVAHRDAREAVRWLDLPLPVVVVQGVAEGRALAASVDQHAGASLATEHLIRLGHTRIAHVSAPLVWIEAEQRRSGWRATLADAGLTPGPEYFGDWTAESGFRVGQAVLADRDVTAVFAANDTMALGLMRAFHEGGLRVPEDISVVGFDNVIDAAQYWPPLTTVEHSFSELGRRAMALVLRALAGEDAPAMESVKPTLVIRQSSGPVRTRS